VSKMADGKKIYEGRVPRFSVDIDVDEVMKESVGEEPSKDFWAIKSVEDSLDTYMQRETCHPMPFILEGDPQQGFSRIERTGLDFQDILVRYTKLPPHGNKKISLRSFQTPVDTLEKKLKERIKTAAKGGLKIKGAYIEAGLRGEIWR